VATLPYRGTGLANLPWYALLGGTHAISGGQTDSGTTLTASATAHTKGSWAQLIASTSAECTALGINIGNVAVSNADTAMLVDIGVGAAGSEVVRVENIAVGGATLLARGSGGLFFMLPLRIAAGSRIAARCQSVRTSGTGVIHCAPMAMGASHVVPTAVDVLGASTADSRGTAMSGASGTWVEITGSTARDYSAVLVIPSIIGTTITTARAVRYTIGIGAAGAEVAIGSTLADYTTLERVQTYGASPYLPMSYRIPAGSRIAVQHDIAANPGQIAACVIGVPA